MIKFRKIEHNVRKLLPKAVEYLQACPEVSVAYLFGSRAQGIDRPLADIDLAVLLKDGLVKERIWRLEDTIAVDLARVLGTDEIDLVCLNTAPLRMKYEVVVKGQVLCSTDETTRAEFESYVLRRYWDFQKYLDEYHKFLTRRIKEEMNEDQREEYRNSLGEIRSIHRRVKEAAEA